MLRKINQNTAEIKSFLAQVQAQLARELASRIEAQLESEVEAWLYRGYHVRKAGVKRRSQAMCQSCKSQAACDFMRNGHRKRQLVTQLGVVSFWLPRVVCRCGGSVQIPFSILKPYQQIWDDVLLQIQRWADLGLSLRQMQGEVAETMGAQVGLRTLNEQVQRVQTPTRIELSSVAPVVMLDAIYLTLLEETAQHAMDALGRKRPVKQAKKVCVLVALGLYPQTGRWGILDWTVADEESQAAWERLLIPLETRGLYRQRGLELFIHDGNSGLTAALNLLYPTIPHQRCAFHKLRNLWQAIQTPQGLSRPKKRAFKQALMTQAVAIFYADHLKKAQEIRDDLSLKYQDTQPTFVSTLQRDWHETIAFFQTLKRFPQWQRKALRTTSLLERLNRMLRRLFRPKCAFHSLSTLLATVARVLNT